jgi:hypothetical protein
MADQDEQYIGVVLPGQGWVELKGIFTLIELEELINKIKSNYEKVE